MIIKDIKSEYLSITITRIKKQKMFNSETIKFLGIGDGKFYGHLEFIADDGKSGRFPMISIIGDKGLFIHKGETVICKIDTKIIDDVIIYCEEDNLLKNFVIRIK